MFTGRFKNGLFIGVLVTNTFTGIIQELRSKKILDKLSVINASNVTVIRNGEKQNIEREKVVKDDLLFLKKGNQVCVDCRVIVCNALSADESLLTGENIPVEKMPGDILLSGCFISSGEGYAVAETVGESCYSAVITAQAKQRKKISSEILRSVEKIVRTMTYIIVPSGMLLFLAHMFLAGLNWKDNIVRTVASMIGMIPNGLVLLITAAYCLGVYRVSFKKALIRETSVMEVFANIETFCFDKTGTLTESGTNNVRKEIPNLINYLYKKGIDIKVISGDKAEYVIEVAKNAGIINPENIVDLTGMDKTLTMEYACKGTIFCRSTPEQKKWIVQGIQKSGKKCAMAGDGVNDVLALKASDCGVSPVSGTDAACGVAGVILMDSDFSALKYVFEEGRRAINNIEKTACLYLNKTTYSLILTVFTIIFAVFGDVKYPFEPIHMTIISSLAIGLPSVLITLQNNTQKLKGKFVYMVLSRAMPFGISVAIVVMLLTLLNNTGVISAESLSFSVYIVTGFTAFFLLFYVGFPHTKTSFFYTILLFAIFVCTIPFGSLLNLGSFNTEVLWVSVPGVVLSLFCSFLLKKNIR